QFWRGKVHQAAIVLIDEAPALDADMPMLAGGMERRTLTLRLPLDHSHRLAWLLGRYHRHVALDDGGLLGGDCGQRSAEIFGVVHADRRNHRSERRLDHIGRIEPSAEAYLEQQHIGLMLREQAERGRGLCLEKSNGRTVIDPFAMLQRAREL